MHATKPQISDQHRQPISTVISKGFILCMGLLLFTIVTPAQAPAADLDPTSKFVEQLATKVMSSAQKIGPTERQTTDQLMRQNVALNVMARACLGRHWQDFNASTRDAYATAFESYVVEILTSLLEEFAGGEIEITRAQTLTGGDHLVSSQITTRKAMTTLMWRVRVPSSGEPQIVDVIADGISAVATMRDDFESILNSANGNAQALVLALNESDLTR